MRVSLVKGCVLQEAHREHYETSGRTDLPCAGLLPVAVIMARVPSLSPSLPPSFLYI